MKISGLRINRLKNPLGFDLGQPSASFYVEDTDGTRPEAIRLQVALDESFSDIVYDTGRSKHLKMSGTALTFELSPRTRYFWRAQVWADNGDHAVSDVAWFETGKLAEPWSAKWIAAPGGMDAPPMLSREFEAAECVRARIYACGLGLYELYLDGEKLGDELLSPGCTEYSRWLQYQTYELELSPGRHRLEAWLGDGWYMGRFGLDQAERVYGDRHKLILELVMDLADGTLRRLVTDKSWSVLPCPVTFSSIYDGEVFDPATAAGAEWAHAQVLEDDTGLLCARLSPPVRVMETRTPVSVIRTPKGETVLDMGQNMAGFLQFMCDAPAGTRLSLQYGELLQDGCFYRGNLRSAKQEFTYISDGKPRLVRPHFTYFGFRYAKLEGFPGDAVPDRFTCCTVYSDLERTGWISTGSGKVDKLISNILWGQKSNYVDVPTDCPQRDERMGWTADAQIFSASACFNMDCFTFLRKYCRDIYETQLRFGHVTNVVPAFHETGPAGSVWGDAAVVIPWNLYVYYGDETILSAQYDSMRRWTEHIRAIDEATGGRRIWDTGFHFGDWLALDSEGSDAMKGATEDGYIATAYYYQAARIVSKAAAVLGKAGDAAEYGRLAGEIRAAMQREYFTPNGRLAITTQTAYALALYMDFAPDGSRPRLAGLLEDKLKKTGGYLRTGFVGTYILSRALSDNGCSEAAYTLLLNEEYPSWLYEVNMGATTVWERWNSVLPDGSIGDTGMNSLNHYAYGSVEDWMVRNMAGLRPDEAHPGFVRAVIAPQPDYRIKRCDLRYLSASGPYEIHWRVSEDGGFTLSAAVPFGAEADIVLPGVPGAPVHVLSGTHEFSYMPSPPIKKLYSVSNSAADILKSPAAAEVLREFVPGYESIPLPLLDSDLEQLSLTPFVSLTDGELQELDRRLRAL